MGGPAGERFRRRTKLVRAVSLAMLVVVLAQYAVGMVVNLIVTISAHQDAHRVATGVVDVDAAAGRDHDAAVVELRDRSVELVLTFSQ
jgi:hypothetical protein